MNSVVRIDCVISQLDFIVTLHSRCSGSWETKLSSVEPAHCTVSLHTPDESFCCNREPATNVKFEQNNLCLRAALPPRHVCLTNALIRSLYILVYRCYFYSICSTSVSPIILTVGTLTWPFINRNISNNPVAHGHVNTWKTLILPLGYSFSNPNTSSCMQRNISLLHVLLARNLVFPLDQDIPIDYNHHAWSNNSHANGLFLMFQKLEYWP